MLRVLLDLDELLDDIGAAVCDVGFEDGLNELVAVVHVLVRPAGLLEDKATERLDGVIERVRGLDVYGRHGCERPRGVLVVLYE